MVDDLAQVFINSIAENRNTTPERVISDFGQGGVLIGARAVQAGLADGISSFETVLSDLSQGKTPEGRKAKVQAADFMSLVSEYQEKHKSTRTEAIKATVKASPESHAAYIAQANPGMEQAEPNTEKATPTGRTEAKTGDNSGFMALVATLQKNRGMTRAEAIREAAKRSPEAHRKYIEEYNQIGG